MSGAADPVPEALEAELLDVARAAARVAAAELLTRYEHTAQGLDTKTTATDPVSDADRAAEAAIRTLLAQRRPGDAILGEEGGETAASKEGSGVRWVVDPLDGTVNYLFRYPQWSVSVAAEDAEGRVLAGVVLDPLRGEELSASRSTGLLRNGAPMAQQPRAETLGVALIATGFAYDAAVRARQAEVLQRVLPRVRDVRRGGSAALDLAWTALGRCDAYWERGVKVWDVAAGGLLCARAGLELHELPPADGMPAGLLAAPPELAGELLALVAGG
ncbi:MAG TPA: inositol monophosphatase family protein [Conexibacter sp.]|nr:inositol monophosphatase family protein [Conexibacter sp.]